MSTKVATNGTRPWRQMCSRHVPISDLFSRQPLSNCMISRDLTYMFIQSLKVWHLQTTDWLNCNQQQALTVKCKLWYSWPQSRNECPVSIMEFYNHHDEMSYEDGLIFRRQTIAIPKCCQLISSQKPFISLIPCINMTQWGDKHKIWI